MSARRGKFGSRSEAGIASCVFPLRWGLTAPRKYACASYKRPETLFAPASRGKSSAPSGCRTRLSGQGHVHEHSGVAAGREQGADLSCRATLAQVGQPLDGAVQGRPQAEPQPIRLLGPTVTPMTSIQSAYLSPQWRARLRPSIHVEALERFLAATPTDSHRFYLLACVAELSDTERGELGLLGPIPAELQGVVDPADYFAPSRYHRLEGLILMQS